MPSACGRGPRLAVAHEGPLAVAKQDELVPLDEVRLRCTAEAKGSCWLLVAMPWRGSRIGQRRSQSAAVPVSQLEHRQIEPTRRLECEVWCSVPSMRDCVLRGGDAEVQEVRPAVPADGFADADADGDAIGCRVRGARFILAIEDDVRARADETEFEINDPAGAHQVRRQMRPPGADGDDAALPVLHSRH